jgi:urease accessory protein
MRPAVADVCEWLPPRVPYRHRDVAQPKGDRTVPRFKTMAAGAAAVVVALCVPPAFAHHVMGGELPGTAWQGVLSGLGHPIIGIDHFAFIVGVGLMSHLAGRLALLPLLFVVGTALGCLLHVRGYGVPLSELAIALTIAIGAVAVGLHARIPIGILTVAFLIAGALHGYAYGESVVGAETTPLVSYIIGFALIQYCLALGSGFALRAIVGRGYLRETVALWMASAGIAVVASIGFINFALAS